MAKCLVWSVDGKWIHLYQLVSYRFAEGDGHWTVEIDCWGAISRERELKRMKGTLGYLEFAARCKQEIIPELCIVSHFGHDIVECPICLWFPLVHSSVGVIDKSVD